VAEPFDIDLLDDEEPFEIEEQSPESMTPTTCGDRIPSSIRPSGRRIGSW
jgi:hypothetical protein